MARSALPKFFELDLNLSLVKTSRLSSFLVSTVCSFLASYTTDRQAMVMLKMNNSGLDRLGATRF